MATTTATKNHHRFPRKLGRFINLEGGLYGSLDLVAISKDVMEIQTGEDFVRFDQDQAKNLRDTIDKFLALESLPHEVVEAVEEQIEEVAAVEGEAETTTRRPSRRPRRPAKG